VSALFILVFVSLLVAGAFLLAFVWSIRDDQYEDQEGAALRMLHDSETISAEHF
jgi:cbb3-type cytochrome oxidase maturation protein